MSQKIGFLLSGPLGHGLTESGLLSNLAGTGVEIVVGVGETPGLRLDFKTGTEESLDLQKVQRASADHVLEHSAAVFCIGWRRMIDGVGKGPPVYVIHDSLLPELQGWNPLVSAVELGLASTGVSLFLANSVPDDGTVLGQEAFRLGPGVSIDDAISRASKATAVLLRRLIPRLISERPAPYFSTTTEPSLSPWRDKEDYIIDWAKPSVAIEQFVLSRSWPYRGAMTMYNGQTVILESARADNCLPKLAIPAPGKVVRFDHGDPIVACGEGYLRVSCLKSESGLEMTVRNLRTRFGAAYPLGT